MNSKKKKAVEDDRLISKPEVLDRVGVTFPMPTQNKFHLDKRAGSLLAADPAPEADDQLLTTREVATFLGMSEQWVTLGRSKKYGPPFVRVGTRRLRYHKSAVRDWLKSRTYSSTAEYPAGEVVAS